MLNSDDPPGLTHFIEMTEQLEIAFEVVSKAEQVDVEVSKSTDYLDASVIKLPQKRFFRQRAHANPFSDHLLE